MYKVIHPQAAAAAATQLPAHLTPPTSLVSNIRYYAFCIWKFTIIVFPGGKAAFDSAHYRYVPNISFTIETCQDCVEFLFNQCSTTWGSGIVYLPLHNLPLGNRFLCLHLNPLPYLDTPTHSMGPALPQSPVDVPTIPCPSTQLWATGIHPASSAGGINSR